MSLPWTNADKGKFIIKSRRWVHYILVASFIVYTLVTVHIHQQIFTICQFGRPIYWYRWEENVVLPNVPCLHKKFIVNLMFQITHLTILVLSEIREKAQMKPSSFVVKDKGISCLECHHRQEIACPGFKKRFLEGGGNDFVTDCTLFENCLSIKETKSAIRC